MRLTAQVTQRRAMPDTDSRTWSLRCRTREWHVRVVPGLLLCDQTTHDLRHEMLATLATMRKLVAGDAGTSLCARCVSRLERIERQTIPPADMPDDTQRRCSLNAATACEPADVAYEFIAHLMRGYPANAPLSCEIRALKPGGNEDDADRVQRRWFGLESEYLRRAAQWCVDLSYQYDVYVGVLPRIGRGGYARDIAYARMLYCDVDAGGDPNGVSSLLERSGLLPYASAVVEMPSGGAHLYWALSDTVDLADAETRAAFRGALKRIVLGIGGPRQGAHADGNAAEEARVLRVPGTLYHKYSPPVRIRRWCRATNSASLEWWNHQLPMQPMSEDHGMQISLRPRKGLARSGRVFASDDDLVRVACNASAEFSSLMSGELGRHGNDESRADMALMMHLAWWTDRDPARMERVFGRSMLARREKWKRHDYRERTIRRALAAI